VTAELIKYDVPISLVNLNKTNLRARNAVFLSFKRKAINSFRGIFFELIEI